MPKRLYRRALRRDPTRFSMARYARASPARAEEASGRPLVWYGHFDWAVHELFGPAGSPPGRYCGVGDDLMLREVPACGRGRGVMAPFASGGIDIRSRGLVELVSGCAELRACGAGGLNDHKHRPAGRAAVRARETDGSPPRRHPGLPAPTKSKQRPTCCVLGCWRSVQ